MSLHLKKTGLCFWVMVKAWLRHGPHAAIEHSKFCVEGTRCSEIHHDATRGFRAVSGFLPVRQWTMATAMEQVFLELELNYIEQQMLRLQMLKHRSRLWWRWSIYLTEPVQVTGSLTEGPRPGNALSLFLRQNKALRTNRIPRCSHHDTVSGVFRRASLAML